MNKFLFAIYRHEAHTLNLHIQNRSSHDRHEINEALKVLVTDTSLSKEERIKTVQTLLLAGEYGTYSSSGCTATKRSITDFRDFLFLKCIADFINSRSTADKPLNCLSLV